MQNPHSLSLKMHCDLSYITPAILYGESAAIMRSISAKNGRQMQFSLVPVQFADLFSHSERPGVLLIDACAS